LTEHQKKLNRKTRACSAVTKKVQISVSVYGEDESKNNKFSRKAELPVNKSVYSDKSLIPMTDCEEYSEPSSILKESNRTESMNKELKTW